VGNLAINSVDNARGGGDRAGERGGIRVGVSRREHDKVQSERFGFSFRAERTREHPSNPSISPIQACPSPPPPFRGQRTRERNEGESDSPGNYRYLIALNLRSFLV